MIKKLIIFIFPFSCQAEYIPSDFSYLYEMKEGYVDVSYGGQTIDVYSKYHTGYFEVDLVEYERLKDFLLYSFDDVNAVKIANTLVSSNSIEQDCQYVSIVCETKNDEINVKVNTDSKKVNLYVGSDFYKKENVSNSIGITSLNLALVSDYRLSYNLNNRKYNNKWVSTDYYSAELNSSIGTGDKYTKLDFYSTETESRIDDAYFGVFFGDASIKAGYISESTLNKSNNGLYSLSSGNGNFLGFSVEKEKKLKKKGISNNYLTVFAPTNTTLVKITKDGKEIYQAELVSGPNYIDLNTFPTGRYLSQIELSVNGVEYKSYQESIVNNVSSKYKVGEVFYGSSVYNYEPDNNEQEDQIVGKVYAEKRLTDDFDVLGTVFHGDKIVYAGRVNYFFDDDISLGSDISFINSDVATVSGDLSLYNFRVNYSESFLSEEYITGFERSLVNQKSKSVTASVNHSFNGANIHLMFNHFLTDDYSSDRVNYSISKYWSSMTTSINGSHSLSGQSKGDYSVGLNISYSLDSDSSISLNQNIGKDKYYAESQYSKKIINNNHIGSTMSLGYKYKDFSDENYYIKSSNSINSDLTSGYLNAQAGNDLISVNTSLSGTVVGTSSGLKTTGNVDKRSSYMVVDSDDETREALLVKMSTPSVDGYSIAVGKQELFEIDNFDEHKVSLSSMDENVVIRSPTIYRFTTGKNSVIKVKADSYRATVVFGEISGLSGSIECEECIDFEIDEYGFFIAKVESIKVFSISNGAKSCEVAGVKFSNYAVNLGSLECKL
ncbi:hypothetical protein L8R85_23455 [Vibrio splendidus]|uniref:Pilus assembly protein E-set like domain-containing protein n=1 Tax=Vibrio splendidus TaxID=29497 RepID=A0AA43G1P6_VIBSP|nr:hypothetical protein [Vibrio splendidus]MDH5923974.1 hypothetical protein [Vibrio splendidus]